MCYCTKRYYEMCIVLFRLTSQCCCVRSSSCGDVWSRFYFEITIFDQCLNVEKSRDSDRVLKSLQHTCRLSMTVIQADIQEGIQGECRYCSRHLGRHLVQVFRHLSRNLGRNLSCSIYRSSQDCTSRLRLSLQDCIIPKKNL